MFRNPVTDSLVVLVVLLVIFGPKRLPMLGRSLGEGFKGFRDSIGGKSSDDAEGTPALITAESSVAPTPGATVSQASPEQQPAP